MSWKSRGTSSITGFTSWSNSDPFTSSILNDIDDDLRTWGANVDAAGFALANCAGVSGPAGANPFTISTNSAERVRVDGAGKVGIGTTSPSGLLSVVGPASANLVTYLTSPSGFGSFLELGVSASNVELAGASNGDFALSHFGVAGGVFQSFRSGAVANTLVISAGKVGIATATPTSPLQVVGLPSFASNAAAISGGLTAGAFYRNGDAVGVVH